MEDIKCPKCHSTQLTSNKKGFSGAKALGGAALVGGVGLLAGTIGSNKVIITCLRCGHQFKAGDYYNEIDKELRKENATTNVVNDKASLTSVIIIFTTLTVIGSIISYKLLANDWTIFGTIFAVATTLSCVFTVSCIIEKTKKNNKTKTKSERSNAANPVSQPIRSTPFVAKQKIKCSKCSTNNILQAKYCMICGIRLDISKMETTINDKPVEFILCEKCTHHTPVNSKYCINCGLIIEK